MYFPKICACGIKLITQTKAATERASSRVAALQGKSDIAYYYCKTVWNSLKEVAEIISF